MVRETIRVRGLESGISLTGQIDSPLSALRSATVLALPSRREGLARGGSRSAFRWHAGRGRDLPGVVEIANQAEGVTLMGEDASDQEWADALIAAAGADRTAIAASFAKSPFRFEHHLAMMTALWSGNSPTALAALVYSSMREPTLLWASEAVIHRDATGRY